MLVESAVMRMLAGSSVLVVVVVVDVVEGASLVTTLEGGAGVVVVVVVDVVVGGVVVVVVVEVVVVVVLDAVGFCVVDVVILLLGWARFGTIGTIGCRVAAVVGGIGLVVTTGCWAGILDVAEGTTTDSNGLSRGAW
jgi:hypothetical protein